MAATPPNDSLTDMDGHSLSVSKSGSKNDNFTTIITENNAPRVSASNLKFNSVWPEFYVMKPVNKLNRVSFLRFRQN